MPFAIAPHDLTLIFPSIENGKPCLLAQDPFAFHINATLDDDLARKLRPLQGTTAGQRAQAHSDESNEDSLPNTDFLAELRGHAAAFTIKQHQMVYDVVLQFLRQYRIPPYLYPRLYTLVQSCLRDNYKSHRRVDIQIIDSNTRPYRLLHDKYSLTTLKFFKSIEKDPFPESYQSLTSSSLPLLFDALLEIERYNAAVIRSLVAEKERSCRAIKKGSNRKISLPEPVGRFQLYFRDIENPSTLDYIWDKLIDEAKAIQRKDYRAFIPLLYQHCRRSRFSLPPATAADDASATHGPEQLSELVLDTRQLTRAILQAGFAEFAHTIDPECLRPLRPTRPVTTTQPLTEGPPITNPLKGLGLSASSASPTLAEPAEGELERTDYEQFCQQHANEIQSLTEMGFELEQSITSLRLYQGDMDRAINILLTKPDIINFHRAKSPRALSITAHLYAGSEGGGTSSIYSSSSPGTSTAPTPTMAFSPITASFSSEANSGISTPHSPRTPLVARSTNSASPLLSTSTNGSINPAVVCGSTLYPQGLGVESTTKAEGDPNPTLVQVNDSSSVKTTVAPAAVVAAPKKEMVDSDELRGRTAAFASYIGDGRARSLALKLGRLTRAWVPVARQQMESDPVPTADQAETTGPLISLELADPVSVFAGPRGPTVSDSGSSLGDLTALSAPPLTARPQDMSDEFAAAVEEELRQMSFVDNFTISLGKPIPLTHNLRLSATNHESFLSLPKHPARRMAVQAQTAASIYSPLLNAVVLLLSPRDWEGNSTGGTIDGLSTSFPSSSSLGLGVVDDNPLDNEIRYYYLGNTANQYFFKQCQQTTEYHFPSVSEQLEASYRQLTTGGQSIRPGDILVTRHSNLPLVHVVFHVVLPDDVLYATRVPTAQAIASTSSPATTDRTAPSGGGLQYSLNQQSVEARSLQLVMDAMTRFDIGTLTLPPYFLSDPDRLQETADSLTRDAYLQKRTTMVFKCIKGFLTSFTQAQLMGRVNHPVHATTPGNGNRPQRNSPPPPPVANPPKVVRPEEEEVGDRWEGVPTDPTPAPSAPGNGQSSKDVAAKPATNGNRGGAREPENAGYNHMEGKTFQFLIPGNVTEVQFNQYRSDIINVFRVN
ncbi:hypothetical protein H4R33_002176 [Dimargaris cristalligena]|nr:hypothetical protein H4R33_002176 [Dimargaris cristalligena]